MCMHRVFCDGSSPVSGRGVCQHSEKGTAPAVNARWHRG